MSEKRNILFLCTGNSCRSQMAEAWTNHLKGDLFEAYSAGVMANMLDPRAVTAMAEAGIDISGKRSKTIDDLPVKDWDLVVTLCGDARENCPVFPGSTKILHRGFDDPPRLARSAVDEEGAMVHYRRVRDEIRNFVNGLDETEAERQD
ncbi:MAG TPA: arsenate reductase ArsC [Deltaproteobacteria bacterium]|nr:arsenate reductase ArsC [Deltaproteobacteria bacterium]